MKSVESVVHPKTFEIHLKEDHRWCPETVWCYCHAETWLDALDWVDKVFPGADTQATRDYWSVPQPVRGGNRLLVTTTNLDYRDKQKDGSERRSKEEVFHRLVKVHSILQSRLTIVAENIEHFENQPPKEWILRRLEESKAKQNLLYDWCSGVLCEITATRQKSF